MSLFDVNGFVKHHHIDDVRSSETMIVDNFQKVQEVLTQLKNDKECHVDSHSHFKQFEFVQKWAQGSLSKADKDRYFSGYSCHEFHLFLRKHDPDYFKEVVQPFVATKMEKTFIDYYILEDHDWIIEQAEVGTFESALNPLE